jgi:hypothetical protein
MESLPDRNARRNGKDEPVDTGSVDCLGTLTDSDLLMFSRLRIGDDLLRQAHVERVTDRDARDRFGLFGYGDRGGIAFHYDNPHTGRRWTTRLRRDNPEIEGGKAKNKYVSAFGDRRHLYFVPGCADLLNDPSVPIVLIEAEKSALALTAWAARTGTRILPVAMGGCWGWRGRIGKRENANGERVDEVGALADLACASGGRKTYILLDANVASNPKVQVAREALASQLRKQRADVRVLDLPAGDGINGPDDFLALRGDEAMRDVFEEAESGVAILNEVQAFVRRFVIMTDAQSVAVALWIVHTHCYEVAIWTPYLQVTSAEKRCAKSRLLEAVGYLVRQPWQTSSATAASLFREIERKRPTLLFDELDALFKGDKEMAQMVRAVLNAGAHRNGVVSRCVGKGTEIESKDFHVFCPKALAGIGNLPETVADRALPIRLRRKLPTETVERLREAIVSPQATPLYKRLTEWSAKQLQALRVSNPNLPEELNDRQQDGAECLLAIADAAGGSWPAKARAALVELYTGEAAEDRSVPTLLLSDVRDIFDDSDADQLPSDEIVRRLLEIQTSPWSEWNRGKPLNQHGLAKLLKPFGIHPQTIRLDDGRTPKGYKRDRFEDDWDRYLRPKDASEALSPPLEPPQPPQCSDDAGQTHFSTPPQDPSVAVQKSEESPLFTRIVAAVAVKKGGQGNMASLKRETYAEDFDL